VNQADKNHESHMWKRQSFVLILFLLAACTAGCHSLRSLGGKPTNQELRRIDTVHNFRDGAFRNREFLVFGRDTAVAPKVRWQDIVKLMLQRPADVRPPYRLPVALTDLRRSEASPPSVTWFGHSTVLLQINGANLLFDPIFNDHAGPVRGLMKSFPFAHEYRLRDLPPIDAVIISHDHYDHLDYETLRRLRKKVRRFVVPLGIGAHLRRWGIADALVTELNWHEHLDLHGLRITATPAHHRSGRAFAQNKTLWAAFVVEGSGKKVYFSGDTGYSLHFQETGARYGPFDLALMECGQYNPKWPRHHLFPEQTVQAALDLKAAALLPVHWGKFAESEHHWSEPVRRVQAAATKAGIPLLIPFIGQPCTIGVPFQQVNWWEW